MIKTPLIPLLYLRRWHNIHEIAIFKYGINVRVPSAIILSSNVKYLVVKPLKA